MRSGTRILVCAMLTMAVGLWAAEDPLMGTWKINVAKSNFGSGAAPKSQVIKLEPIGADGLKQTEVVVNEQDETHHNDYTAQFGDNPIQGDPTKDARVLRRIDAYTMEITYKKAGKVTQQFRREVSQDGKTMTVRFTGTDAQGQPISRTMVFEKQ